MCDSVCQCVPISVCLWEYSCSINDPVSLYCNTAHNFPCPFIFQPKSTLSLPPPLTNDSGAFRTSLIATVYVKVLIFKFTVRKRHWWAHWMSNRMALWLILETKLVPLTINSGSGCMIFNQTTKKPPTALNIKHIISLASSHFLYKVEWSVE